MVSRAVRNSTGVWLPLGAQAAAHLEPVEVGQHHVEHHQVGRDGGHLGEGVAPGRRRRHLEAVVAQGGDEHRTQVVLVVDDQEMLAGHAPEVSHAGL